VNRAAYDEIIQKETDSYVGVYLHARSVGQETTRETKALIESVVATDYDGRALIELIQNAHDAHDRSDPNGRLLVRLDVRRGEHGTLTVANGGRPFNIDNFHAIYRVALSSKPPQEGIGNKGVGFKSILQITHSPAILSVADAGSAEFDGFCFRFANDIDFDTIAHRTDPHDAGLPNELRRSVSALKLPVPIEDNPSALAALPSAGYVTAIDAPLRSESALALTEKMLRELLSDNIPIHLFLDRLRTIRIELITDDDQIENHELTRSVSARENHSEFSTERVLLNGSDEYLLLKRAVPVEVIKRAIATSLADGRIGESYEDWDGDGEVTIAVRTDGQRFIGRYYTFLPMNISAPLAGHVNGPFFAHLNRESMERSVPLNSCLIDAVADLAVAAASKEAGTVDLSAGSIVDLLSWTDPSELKQLAEAFSRRGCDIASSKVIPVGSGTDRAALDEVWIWEPSDATVITSAAVTDATDTPFLTAGLGAERSAAVAAIAKSCGLPTTPSGTELAEWSSSIAATALAKQRAAGQLDLDWWATFYDELALLIPKPKGHFSEASIILSDNEELLAPENLSGPTLFFHPRSSDSEDGALTLPDEIAHEVRFTHRGLPRLAAQNKRPGRVWLETFVKDYSSESILELVRKGMQGSRTEQHRRTLLKFAFDVWYGVSRERPTKALQRYRPMVPTLGLWRDANTARFSEGWGDGEEADIASKYEQFVRDASSDAPELAPLQDQLIRPTTDGSWDGRPAEAWFKFLSAAGVQNGLYPQASDRPFELHGSVVSREPGFIARPPGMSAAEHAILNEAAETLATGRGLYKQQYVTDQPLWRLPGQQYYEAFSPDVRSKFAELVIRCIAEWPEASMRLVFSRHSHPRAAVWPSLVTSFLNQSAWMPQRVPGISGLVTYTRPQDGWWVSDGDGPTYLAAQPRGLTRWTSESTLRRLKEVGTRFWDAAATAPDRLRTLIEVAKQYAPQDRELTEIRNAYAEAWTETLEEGEPTSQVAVLVSREQELEVLSLATSETVFVIDSAGRAKQRLLEQVPVPVLAIRDPSLAGRVHEHIRTGSPATFELASRAAVEVTVNGASVDSIQTTPLLTRWPWLLDLVLTLVETRASAFHRAGKRRLAEVADTLKALRFASVPSIETSIAGYEVDATRGELVITVEQGRQPVILVMSGSTHDSPTWVLEQAAKAIMGAVGFGDLQAEFTVALMRLGRDGIGEPTQVQIARALDVPDRDVERAANELGLGPVIVYNVQMLVAMFNPDLAEQLAERASSFSSPSEVTAWLTEHASNGTAFDPEQLVQWALRDDLPAAVEALGVALSHANRVMREFDRAPLHNVEGHERSYRSYRDRHLVDHLDQLRASFVDVYRNRDPLDDYLRLRDELQELPSPDVWLDEYWTLPHEVIHEHFARWIAANAIAPEARAILEPLRQVQDRNRNVVQGTMSQLPPTVLAWARRNEVQPPNLPDLGTVLNQIEVAGRLDFDVFDASEIVNTIVDLGQWPGGMPLTLTLEQLGLTPADIEAERNYKRVAEEAARRRRDSVRYGTTEYSGEETDRAALIAAVLSNLPPLVMATTTESQVITMIPQGRRPTRMTGGGNSGRPSQVKTGQIGFIGELIASKWIELQYGVHPKDSWKSGYRAEFLGEEGDDSLGYDFEVVTPTETLRIEVKATTGDDNQFELGETEVRCAQSLQTHERYIILLLNAVQDPERATLQVLPNPFEHGGLINYSLLGQKLRLGFAPRTENPLLDGLLD